jgi:hypothetical protein
MLDMQARNAVDSSVYAALNRRNILANSTWTVPLRDIGGIGSSRGERNAFRTRLPDRSELLTRLWAIKALAEGKTGTTMRDGARMPALTGAVATAAAWRSDGRRQRPCSGAELLLPLRSVQASGTRFPRHSCVLWTYDCWTSVHLLGAVQRPGLTDTMPLRELTPPGANDKVEG